MIDPSLYTDDQLFSQIATGNHPAFKILVERHRSNLYGHAMAFLKDPFKAQDLVQEVFLSIWNARQTLPAIKNPESYLFIIARNKIVSELRKTFPLPISEALEHLYAGSEPGPDHLLEHKQLQTLIQSAISQMPPQRRLVFELSKKEGLKYEEIAARLNISPNTVKVHMVQALSFIRSLVRNQVSLLLYFFLFR